MMFQCRIKHWILRILYKAFCGIAQAHISDCFHSINLLSFLFGKFSYILFLISKYPSLYISSVFKRTSHLFCLWCLPFPMTCVWLKHSEWTSFAETFFSSRKLRLLEYESPVYWQQGFHNRLWSPHHIVSIGYLDIGTIVNIGGFSIFWCVNQVRNLSLIIYMKT